MKINDKEYQSWHEIGHAISCIKAGGFVEFVELSLDDSLPWLARARCSRGTQELRMNTASGGFALEYLLYKYKYIKISRDELIYEAHLNSINDKNIFFNYKQTNKSFTKKENTIFEKYAIQKSEELSPFMYKIKDIVNKLIDQQKIYGHEIIDILSGKLNDEKTLR